MQSDLVQHPGEIDQAFRFLIVRAGSLIVHCTKTSRLVLQWSTDHLRLGDQTTLQNY
jgi:hypothetical protein